MNALTGADTRRVDIIAEGLRGCLQEVHSLRSIGQVAVAEMRNAWGGQDFDRIAQRWDQEAGPRLADVLAALDTMATTLRTQAQEQRRASGDAPGSSVLPAGRVTPQGDNRPADLAVLDIDIRVPPGWADTSTATLISGHEVSRDRNVQWGPPGAIGERVNEPTAADHVKLNLAQGAVVFGDKSLASLKHGDGDSQYELSAGRVEAGADYSVDVDAHGNVVASAGASAAAYAGYAAGRVRRGNDFMNGTAEGIAFVGAAARTDASGGVGRSGARGHLAAEAFAGAKVEGIASGTVAGVTATAGAEISYGIGASVDIDAEFSSSHVAISADLGAALGLGAGFNAEVSVNPREVMTTIGHAADGAGEMLASAGENIYVAGDDIVRDFLDW